ncbi:MAG: ISKra4 family transposase [Peptococcaceae bacterium]|nr:ISKra4 family transposase [Peptococcaceae bacterium]
MDLEASEMAVRSMMLNVGAFSLEKLLTLSDRSHDTSSTDCGQGHQAKFVEYRAKHVYTILGHIMISRPYHHCVPCKKGAIPRDQDLDIVGTSFSPGLRRMMAWVGGKESFDEGQRDLEELAGIVVKTKEVERISENIGEQVEYTDNHERQGIWDGKVAPLTPAVPKLYIAIDGTGVPVVPYETEGRRGKHEDGKAKTREAKLGCAFTQTKVDDRGHPVRDPETTTYTGAIENVEAFGMRIYAEAVRRGLHAATQTIVLGDGAPWIWGLADEHFHGATQIVDLYHAREHISDVGKILGDSPGFDSDKWVSERTEELNNGEVEKVIAGLERLKPKGEKAETGVRRAIGYFQTNADRMRYSQFRSQGLFIGSGVVEAGCKVVVGRRLKQSGMRWTVKGANAIIALRCCQLSRRWEGYWETRSFG